MSERKIRVTINGTGFAGDYTARVYGMIPHKNGITIEPAGVCSGHLENARGFAKQHGISASFENHGKMLAELQPDIDNIACANYVHGQYAMESADAGDLVSHAPPVSRSRIRQ